MFDRKGPLHPANTSRLPEFALLTAVSNKRKKREHEVIAVDGGEAMLRPDGLMRYGEL